MRREEAPFQPLLPALLPRWAGVRDGPQPPGPRLCHSHSHDGVRALFDLSLAAPGGGGKLTGVVGRVSLF